MWGDPERPQGVASDLNIQEVGNWKGPPAHDNPKYSYLI